MMAIPSRVLAAVGARALGAGVTLVMVVAMGRRLGPSGAGIVLLSWTSIQYLGAFARVGTHVVLLRTASQSAALGRHASIRGVTLQAGGVALAVALGLAVVGVLLRAPISSVTSSSAQADDVVALFALALPAVTLGYLSVEVMKALGRVELASFVQTGLIPLFVLPQVLLLDRLDPGRAAVAFLTSAVASCAVAGGTAFALVGGLGPVEFIRRDDFVSSAWVVALFDTASFSAQWFPLIGVSVLLGDADVGVLITASRLAAAAGVVVVGLTNVLGPQFARMAMVGDLEGIGSVLRRVSSSVLTASLVVVPLLVAGSPWAMSLAGEEFRRGAPILVLLGLGQLLWAATSPAGHVLAMLGHEKRLLVDALTVLALGVALVCLLSPSVGLFGGATAIACATGLQGLLNARSVRLVTGLSSAPAVIHSAPGRP